MVFLKRLESYYYFISYICHNSLSTLHMVSVRSGYVNRMATSCVFQVSNESFMPVKSQNIIPTSKIVA